MATRRDLFEIEAQVPRGTLVYLAPERIQPNPRQPRQQISRSGLEELKASIAARGILQALLGVRGEQGRVILIAGHRRWQAARELGFARVPIVLVDNRDEGADPLIDAIIENVQRENLAPWEEGESYRQLANEFGWDHKQIARSIGKSRPYVTQRIRAAENLAPAVKEFFLTGDCHALGDDALKTTASEVTAVTPCEESNNLPGEGLASFLNNVELVRRLSALSPEDQVASVQQSLVAALQQHKPLSLPGLIGQLKEKRDLAPGHKARLKSTGVSASTNQTTEGELNQLSFDIADLAVVRWSREPVQAKAKAEPDPERLAVDELIARYEQDLEKLRRWREQQPDGQPNRPAGLAGKAG
jgi:ParB family chromosome partitioning protein